VSYKVRPAPDSAVTQVTAPPQLPLKLSGSARGDDFFLTLEGLTKSFEMNANHSHTLRGFQLVRQLASRVRTAYSLLEYLQ
jgi:hypothetical protein